MTQGIAPDGVSLREHRAFKGDDPAVDAYWEERFDKQLAARINKLKLSKKQQQEHVAEWRRRRAAGMRLRTCGICGVCSTRACVVKGSRDR